MNERLAETTAALGGLLTTTLTVDDYIDFESLKEVVAIAPFAPGALSVEEKAPDARDFVPTAPHGLGKLVPGAKARWEEEMGQAKEAFIKLLDAHRERETERLAHLEEAERAYRAQVAQAEAAVQKQHAEIDTLRDRFETNDPHSIAAYFTQVVDSSAYPDVFPRHTRCAFVPESKQLVVEIELPPYEAIPEWKSFKYVKPRDEISSTPLPATQRRTLYSSVVSQVALRTLHEIFEADRTAKLETVVLNAFVSTRDKRTGQAVRPCLVTVRTTRDQFVGLNLANVDPAECLKGLSASLSRSPAELAPVRPVLEFNMVDPRFIEESDVISTLDSRPNLMKLTPGEFESLITNLFEAMGLDTRATQASRDGGVDCVAFDSRPILGGKVVIQAKRYKNTVGVSAVRDLFGTMQNEGASKGILVTTSGYGKASFEFAAGKPLELLDGGNLLYLLKEHAGIDAQIIPPEDWVDPVFGDAPDLI